MSAIDLSTTYLGLSLKNPLVPSASPLSHKLDSMKTLEDQGAAAIVLYSLFEEEIEQESAAVDSYLSTGAESYAEALSYFPNIPEFEATRPDSYLEHIRAAKEALEIPVIASLNGATPGGWSRYARLMQEAGADGLEVNMYYVPTNANHTGESVEDMYVDLLEQMTAELTIPVALKLHPFFSSLPYTARRFARKGAKGLVLFNRFYQPDLDIDQLDVVSSLSLSTSQDLLLPLRWIGILYGQVDADMALTSGVHTHVDVVKGLMVGANVTMMASTLLKHGPERLGVILRDLKWWMEEMEYHSVEQMRGSMSQMHVSNPGAFERVNYMKILKSFSRDYWA